jgi:hypothetical protein
MTSSVVSWMTLATGCQYRLAREYPSFAVAFGSYPPPCASRRRSLGSQGGRSSSDHLTSPSWASLLAFRTGHYVATTRIDEVKGAWVSVAWDTTGSLGWGVGEDRGGLKTSSPHRCSYGIAKNQEPPVRAARGPASKPSGDILNTLFRLRDVDLQTAVIASHYTRRDPKVARPRPRACRGPSIAPFLFRSIAPALELS